MQDFYFVTIISYKCDLNEKEIDWKILFFSVIKKYFRKKNKKSALYGFFFKNWFSLIGAWEWSA